ncbi:phage antirepressor KilAC domain-containing protein [Mammaliicoccus fleurettii]|uniref:phage antirepressor KilAC domain-containing protein n=1 Tax=Mammaliicoccus fleurettii TaxID=150056 RepID=UPI002DBB5564|nr:phage antirepressor KilAC domain-containing protein [Mammaliicoccus fleurettii]MEB7723433.1 phage antirepressor KilAC domain-containing protein [Mammaliicoccus fleurettii]
MTNAIAEKQNVSGMFNIQEKENGEIAISGRELHEALEVKTEYKKWFGRMSEYGFEEEIDYTRVTQKCLTPGGYQNLTDHALTLDTAKEIAMIQRSEPGKQARQYFIQVEKAWNSPEMIMQRALKIANNTKLQLEAQIERDKPKVLFADAVDTSTSSILVGELAKLLSQNGVKIGQNRLFQWLRNNGYLIKKQGESYNLPTQRSMDLKIMDIKKRTQNNPDGSIRVTRTTKITGKGQQYFINKFLNKEDI